MKKYIFPITIGVVFALALAIFLLTNQNSKSAVSIKNYICAENGELGVEHIIALTEISDQFDLVFYYTSNGQIAANFLAKYENGQYTKLVMTSSQSLDHINHIIASSRVLGDCESTLYWGIAQSSDWTINHPNAHQIMIDDLTLGYYIHNKSLDEETLDIKFVHSES